jgi:hypothetical protein
LLSGLATTGSLERRALGQDSGSAATTQSLLGPGL